MSNNTNNKAFPWWGWLMAFAILLLTGLLIASNFDINVSKLVKVPADSNANVGLVDSGEINIEVSAEAVASADCNNDCTDSEAPTPVTVSFNTQLLLDLGFPGSEWVIPTKAQGWACPQEIAEGMQTYGPYTETVDAETRVWIGIGNKKSDKMYTYSFAGCQNPAEEITKQKFFTGADKNPVNGLIFDVIFDNEKINRELQFPD